MLSGVLSHTVALEEAIQKWGHDGALHVMTSRGHALYPSQLLGSPSMEKLISRLETDYEVVVIDIESSASHGSGNTGVEGQRGGFGCQRSWLHKMLGVRGRRPL